MATKTSGEIERELIDSLKDATGRDLGQWMAIIDKSGRRKRNDVLNWLKRQHSFGHMNASLLAGIYRNEGKLVYASTADLLDNQFARAAEMRGLYESFVAFALKHFPGASILPKKTYVSVLERREFAAINIRPKELRVGLDLGDRAFDEIVTKARLSGPMPRMSHMIALTSADQLRPSLIQLLDASHRRCH